MSDVCKINVELWYVYDREFTVAMILRYVISSGTVTIGKISHCHFYCLTHRRIKIHFPLLSTDEQFAELLPLLRSTRSVMPGLRTRYHQSMVHMNVPISFRNSTFSFIELD